MQVTLNKTEVLAIKETIILLDSERGTDYSSIRITECTEYFEKAAGRMFKFSIDVFYMERKICNVSGSFINDPSVGIKVKDAFRADYV